MSMAELTAEKVMETLHGRTIYWGSGSPPAWRVLLALEEKKLPYNGRLISFSCGDLCSPEIRALSPRGKVPILVDSGFIIYESLAILMYLEDTYPEFPLLPQESRARGRALMRMEEANNASTAAGEIIYYVRACSPDEIDEDYIESKHQALITELNIWESYLVENTCSVNMEGSDVEDVTYESDEVFVAGLTLTLADLAFFPQLAYMVRCGLDLSNYPYLTKYYEQMLARPSVQSTWPPHWKESEGLPLLRLGSAE